MPSPPQTAGKPASKLSGDFARVLPHLDLDDQGKTALAGCHDSIEALTRLEQAGLLIEATRLIAHALPAREAVWWCACSRHTAPPAPMRRPRRRCAMRRRSGSANRPMNIAERR